MFLFNISLHENLNYDDFYNNLSYILNFLTSVHVMTILLVSTHLNKNGFVPYLIVSHIVDKFLV